MPSGPVRGPRGGGWLLFWMGLLLLSGVATFDAKLYINGDNVDYIRLAESARAGDLWASPKYPPLFPWLLVLPQALFGIALVPQKILVFCLYLLSGLLLMRRSRRLFGRGWGEPIAWIAMTMVPVLEFGHYVMSEIPFLLFSLLALDALEPGGDAPGSPLGGKIGAGRILLAVAASAAAFYTRSVGLALWVAIGVAAWCLPGIGRRGRLLLLFSSLLLLLPWFLRSTLGPQNPYFSQLVLVNPFYPEWGRLDAGGWLRRIVENLRLYPLGEIPTQLLPVFFRSTYDPPELRYRFLPPGVALLPLLLAAGGLVLSLRRRQPLGLYLCLYLLVLLAWPPLWTGLRFLVPVLPLLAILMFQGLFWLLGILGRSLPPRRRLAQAALLLWIALAARNQVQLHRQARSYPPAWDAYFRAAAWLRENTEPDALILDRKPAMVAYASGRRAIAFPREQDPDRLFDWVERSGVDYLLLPSIPYEDIHRFLIPMVEKRQDRFYPLFEIEEPYTAVLGIIRDGGGPGAR